MTESRNPNTFSLTPVGPFLSVEVTSRWPIHSIPVVMENARNIDTVFLNRGSSLPPHMRPRDLDGCGSVLSYHQGWKRSMEVFISEEGPLKWIGVAMIQISDVPNASYKIDISSSMTQPDPLQPLQSVQ